MTRPEVTSVIDDLPAPAAVPRSNGELVFAQPWEARAFALAVALCEADRYAWDEFRRRLINAVGEAPEDDGTGYYRVWLASLERLVQDMGFVTSAEMMDRIRSLEHEDAHEDHDGGNHSHQH
jgi:nitrile hydratase accessory protein